MFQARLLFSTAKGSRSRSSAARAKPQLHAPLKQSLLLAALLHVWLVLLLGNAPGGTAKPGEGVWGRLNITLRAPENGDPSGTPQLPPVPDDNAGPLGQAKQPRFGGVPRPLPTADQPKPTQPGAAQLGIWQAAPAVPQAEVPAQPKQSRQPSVEAEALPVTRPIASPAPAPVPAPAILALPEPAPMPAQPARFLVPAPLAVVAIPSQAVPVQTPLIVPKFEALPAAPEALPMQTPVSVSAAGPGPIELKAFDAATGPTVQRARPAALLSPGANQASPQVLDFAPVLPALQGRPEAAPFPTPVAAPEVASLAQPPQPPQPGKSLPEPAPLPSLSAQPLQAPSAFKPLTPSALARAPALPPVSAAPTPVPSPALTPLASTPAPAEPAAAKSAPGTSSATEAAPSVSQQDRSQVRLGQASSQDHFGTPDAGSRLGHDVATPPSASASAPQAPLQLNLSLPPRPRGGELSGRGSRGVLELLPTPPERKSKLSQDIENAAKQDCRKAYAEGGLLAAVPLAVNALRDKGCRW